MPKDLKTIFENLAGVAPEDLDKEILKAAVLAELETINMYEQLAEMTRSRELRTTILDVIRNKRMQTGELQAQMMQMGLALDELMGEKR
jgi:hypothetical protein